MSQTRIAFCITELDPGGAERCLADLVERLDRQRFEPVVYCLGPRPIGNPPTLADRIESTGAAVHDFGARRAYQFPRTVKRVAARMQADSPQIVQSFLFHANVVAPWAARRAGVPHVVTGIRVAERRKRWHLRLARWADGWVDRHVCVSESVRAFSAGAGGLPNDKLLVIPNGVDLKRFATARSAPPSDLGIPSGRRLLAFVGRLDRQKGLDWLLRLLPRMLDGLPDYDLLVVGAGPRRVALAELAAQVGLVDRVRFVGYRGDIPKILAASELLLLPSRWEGMPNVVLEAMAAGKPVVATEVEGVVEALGPAGSRQIVRPDHGEAFAAKVRVILQDAALAAELGQANRARVEEHFSITAMVESYERLYESLASGRA